MHDTSAKACCTGGMRARGSAGTARAAVRERSALKLAMNLFDERLSLMCVGRDGVEPVGAASGEEREKHPETKKALRPVAMLLGAEVNDPAHPQQRRR